MVVSETGCLTGLSGYYLPPSRYPVEPSGPARVIREYAQAVGVSIGNVLRAQYFMTDIRDFVGVSAAG